EVRRALGRLGLPSELTEHALARCGATGGRDLLAVVGAVAELIAPARRAAGPPVGPGQVLAVVGPSALAYEEAVGLARVWRLPAGCVWLAASNRAGTDVPASRVLPSPAQALDRLAALRRSRTPVLVAVDAAFEIEAWQWAARVVSALAAEEVWVQVDATRKTADAQAVLDQLTGVAGLLVHQASVTTDPGSVLGLGLPVIGLDGRPATRRAWTGLLAGHLGQW
ncbi:MAG: hypothetical protein ACYCU5_12335, partial [Actinomycetes bacterium]